MSIDTQQLRATARSLSGPNWNCLTPGGVDYVLAAANEVDALRADRDRLREALKFYAEQGHFLISDEEAWDTVSGEPQNLWCDEAGTATVEDGSIARVALQGESHG